MAILRWSSGCALLVLIAQSILSTQAQLSRDPCGFFECQNGGSCTAPADAPYCICPPGFTGSHCEERIISRDPCRFFECQNGGSCTAPADFPYCICPAGFTGRFCGDRIISRDPCRFFECQNGGTCTSPLDIPFCRCPPGFSGDRCQDTSSISPGSCPPIGPDSVGVCGGFFCSGDDECAGNGKCCPSACGGNLCTRPIVIFDPCGNFQCLNGGFCTAPADAPMCICPQGFTGTNCETPVGDKPGLCPAVEPFGVCGGKICTQDSECPGNEKCCDSPCGGKLCLDPFVPSPPPRASCELIDCAPEFICRLVTQCSDCALEARCVPLETITDDLDDVCQNRAYLNVVLQLRSGTSDVYDPKKCTTLTSSSLDCPRGSVCADGFCCEGKPLQKEGTCPAVGDLEVCGGLVCTQDLDCPGQQKCCESSCGSRTCKDPVPFPPPQRISCANVLCVRGTICREVIQCPTCDPIPVCLQPDLLGDGIDLECNRQDFLRVLLVEDSRTSPVSYNQLKCRGPLATRDCPEGFECVDDLRGGGTCCEGKSDTPIEKPGSCPTGDFSVCGGVFCTKDFDCPEDQKCCPGCGNLCTDPVLTGEQCGNSICKPGETCIQLQPVCPPGMACIQAFIPTCVPEGCANCERGEVCEQIPLSDRSRCVRKFNCGLNAPCPIGQQCIDTDEGQTLCVPDVDDDLCGGCDDDEVCIDTGKRCITQPCDTYQCVKRDNCGGCKPGDVCIDTGIRCVKAPCPTYQCVKDNECGGCIPGQVCIDTGIRCITEPCDTYQCVPDNQCGGCPPGKICDLLYPPCAPPPDCEVLREQNPDADCIIPECKPIPVCVDGPDPPVCPLRCGPGQECQLLPTPCPNPTEFCEEQRLRDPSVECIPPVCEPVPVCVDIYVPPTVPPKPIPICPFKCPNNHICQFTDTPCDGQDCNDHPLPTCVPQVPELSSCPKPSRLIDPDSRQCRREQRRYRMCEADTDCRKPDERCCPSQCNNRVCMRVNVRFNLLSGN